MIFYLTVDDFPSLAASVFFAPIAITALLEPCSNRSAFLLLLLSVLLQISVTSLPF